MIQELRDRQKRKITTIPQIWDPMVIAAATKMSPIDQRHFKASCYFFGQAVCLLSWSNFLLWNSVVNFHFSHHPFKEGFTHQQSQNDCSKLSFQWVVLVRKEVPKRIICPTPTIKLHLWSISHHFSGHLVTCQYDAFQPILWV